jgi:hypothetical protein
VKATVEVRQTIEVDVPDATVDEVMSEDWQSHFYKFATRDDAVAWIAWVCEEWGGPDHVDGLYGLGPITARLVDQQQEVVSG